MIYEIKTKQVLPISLKEAWDFFSTPYNLNLITPPDMHFDILGDYEKTYAGQLIRYKIKPFLGIPMDWVTEITQCVEEYYFIDEQRFGPYKFWHHTHRFTQTEEGVFMEDILRYSLPFGWIGSFVNTIFVGKKINNIFSYREKRLKEIFKDNYSIAT